MKRKFPLFSDAPLSYAPLYPLALSSFEYSKLNNLRQTLRELYLLGVHGLLLQVQNTNEDILRVAVEECHALKLQFWLQNTPQQKDAQAQYLKFVVFETREGSSWKLPPLSGKLLRVFAVPLEGPERATNWHETRTFNESNLEKLKLGQGAARFYLFTVEIEKQFDALNANQVRG